MLDLFEGVVYIKERKNFAFETILKNSKCEADFDSFECITNLVENNENIFCCFHPSFCYNNMIMLMETVTGEKNINKIIQSNNNYIVFSVQKYYNEIIMRGLETSNERLISMNERLNNYKLQYRNGKRKKIAKYYNENE